MKNLVLIFAILRWRKAPEKYPLVKKPIGGRGRVINQCLASTNPTLCPPYSARPILVSDALEVIRDAVRSGRMNSYQAREFANELNDFVIGK